jgi:hypothetical protein
MKKIALLIIFTSLMSSCTRQNPDSDSLESFLKDRNAVGNFLSKSFATLPEGASLTKLSENKKPYDGTFPGDSQIRSVVAHKQWSSRSSYFFSLNLSDAMLASLDQSRSVTMIAAQLLNHYFGGLSSLGFQNTGSPNNLIEYPVQYASNTWFKEPGNNITIFGSVYVNIENKTALVDLKVSEVYQDINK